MKNTEEQAILLIEDNPGDIKLIKEMLTEITSFNYKLIVAETLKDGCEQIKNNNFVLILLDLNLPDSIGKQTFDTIIKFTESIPIVSVSGLKDVELPLSLIQEGAQDYIEKKDLNSSLLAKTIQYALMRKQAEENLRKSENRYRDLFNHANEGLLIMTPDGQLCDLNSAFAEMHGYTVDELKNYDIRKLDVLGDKTLDDRSDPIGRILAGEVVRFEVEHYHKDGHIFPLSVTVSLISLGDKLFFQAFHQDITERKRTETALRESEEKFRSVFDQSPVGSTIVGLDKHFYQCNSAFCKFLGYPENELIGKTISDVTHPDDIGLGMKEMKQILEREIKSFTVEKRYLRKDGNIVWGINSFSLVSDANNKPLYFLPIIQDITERKQAEQELIKAKEHAEESDNLKSAFLANMSHEIRTPMNGILGFASLLKEPGLTGEEQQNYIRIIEKSGARMLNIINDIVDISKIEAGQMEVDLKESNINDQIEYIYTFFKPEVEAKGMQLFFKNSLPAKEAIIETDREKIYAILTNLVKNAIKYTNEGSIEFGYTLVETQHAASPDGASIETQNSAFLQFFVKDTGIGIAKNRQEAIFERFIQADMFDTHAYQGAGLGLSISKAYVEMLGGKIRVESEPGKGSLFYFTIPYNTNKQEQRAIANVVSAEDKEVQIKNLKILIVEDDETSDYLITSMLKKNNHEVLHTKTGIETIEVCRNNADIDLILMDIRMPGMSGYEATRQIRQFNKDVIIIAQTAYGLSGDRQKALDAGCNEYLSKPIDKDELLKLMQKYFKR